MLEQAHKYFKDRYPKEHRHMMRLWSLSWRASKPLCVAAILILSTPAVFLGFFIGRQTTTTNIIMPSTITSTSPSADQRIAMKGLIGVGITDGEKLLKNWDTKNDDSFEHETNFWINRVGHLIEDAYGNGEVSVLM